MMQMKKAALIVSGILLIIAIILAHPKDVFVQVLRVGLPNIGIAALFLVGSTMLGAIRFLRLLEMNAANTGWRLGLRSYMAGNVGTLFFLPLLGQAGGRQLLLERAGVGSELNTSIIVVERFATAFLSAALAALSGVYLLGLKEVNAWLISVRIVPIAIAMSLTLILAIWVFGSRRFRGNALNMVNVKLFARGAETILITLLQLVCMIASFGAIAISLAPEVDFLSLLSVCAIVSFCAALPISVGGWGAREVAAIAFFGLLGMQSSEALAITISTALIALSLTLITAYLAFALIKEEANANKKILDAIPSSGKLVGGMTLAVPYMGAVAIFYQFHVSLPQGIINLSLADPFAMLALMVVGSSCIKDKALPTWRMPALNMIFGMISILIAYGIAVAYVRTGIVPPSLVSRGLGWIVILGYVSMGMLFIKSLGNRGFSRALVLLVSAATATIIVEIAHRWFHVLGIIDVLPNPNFEGFSGNRNAFSFLVLLVICGIMAKSNALMKVSGRSRVLWMSGLILLATSILLTSSRTGMATLFSILVATYFFKIQSFKRMFIVGLGAIAAWLLVLAVEGALTYIADSEFNFWKLQTPFSSEGSDVSREKVNELAWDLYRQTPWFGQGLGTFVDKSRALLGEPIMIHNTWLWILVEFGIIGFSIAAFILWLFVSYIFKIRCWASDSRNKAILLGLFCFGLFSLMHEMSFQRILWFGVGLLFIVVRNDGSDSNPLGARTGTL